VLKADHRGKAFRLKKGEGQQSDQAEGLSQVISGRFSSRKSRLGRKREAKPGGKTRGENTYEGTSTSTGRDTGGWRGKLRKKNYRRDVYPDLRLNIRERQVTEPEHQRLPKRENTWNIIQDRSRVFEKFQAERPNKEKSGANTVGMSF